MHELALARHLIDLIEESLPSVGSGRVKQINLRLGEASAMARALQFCFRSAAQGTSCQEAILLIDEVPMTIRCHQCRDIKAPQGRYSFRCPDCGTTAREIVTGREMMLTSIELFDNGPNSLAQPAGYGTFPIGVCHA
ncbi:MAG: hydrogenase maturation nickel metallochaperone HypA [Rhodobacteraceae bacterium]|nr:hydrogenase maturation nickel metallochaperone HypA [Paracoccaceae bacterium]